MSKELIELAKYADASHENVAITPFLMRFAQLIENATMEKAAVACEDVWEEEVYRSALYAAAAIRGMKGSVN
jgi:hypothetical protein